MDTCQNHDLQFFSHLIFRNSEKVKDGTIFHTILGSTLATITEGNDKIEIFWSAVFFSQTNLKCQWNLVILYLDLNYRLL